jgi:hypothetical protein
VCKSDIWPLANIFYEIIFLRHFNDVNDVSIENIKKLSQLGKNKKIQLMKKDHSIIGRE